VQQCPAIHEQVSVCVDQQVWCGLTLGLCGSESYWRHHCYYKAEKLLKLPTQIYHLPTKLIPHHF